MSKEEFERSRNFLTKYVNLLTKTKDAELGYAIDSQYYGIPDYNRYIKDSLAKLTVDDVNTAIRKHLTADNLQIAVVGKDCESLRKKHDRQRAVADDLQFAQSQRAAGGGRPGRKVQDQRQSAVRENRPG